MQEIHHREQQHLQRALPQWLAHPNIQLLASDRSAFHSTSRLSIVSLRISLPESVGGNAGPEHVKYLHQNYVVGLLNDLYGIQARAGCFCAGPYLQRLLDLSAIPECVVRPEGAYIYTPGAVRLSFNYFITEAEADFITQAVCQIASYGWRLLPLYAGDLTTGHYSICKPGKHKYSETTPSMMAFSALDKYKGSHERACVSGAKCLKQAMKVYTSDHKVDLGEQVDITLNGKPAQLPAKLESIRWFAVGSDVMGKIKSEKP